VKTERFETLQHYPMRSAVSAQRCPPKMLTMAPPMVIFKNKFSTLCYISRPHGLQNQIF